LLTILNAMVRDGQPFQEDHMPAWHRPA
jgi:hypothetical protein